jgi:hypothetical protein
MDEVRIPRSVLLMWGRAIYRAVDLQLRGKGVEGVAVLTELHELIEREHSKETEPCSKA